jgi:metal-responsive CopG/Arc/MetJ family transcriptional regulator
MRHRISVTLEQETVLGILGMLRDPRFCNRSQIVEFALKKFFEENKSS